MIHIIKDPVVFTHRYFPPVILHRDEEIKELSYIMNKPLSGQTVKNTEIKGVSGTGKTLITRYVSDRLVSECNDVKICYVRLRGRETEFSAVNGVTQALMGEEVKGKSPDMIYNQIYRYINKLNEKYMIFIFDEIDGLIKGLDNFMDKFLRAYENFDLGNKEVSAIFITNSVQFPKGLGAGTRSSYDCSEKLVFSPYDANHLRDILTERALIGLVTGTYEDMIPLCAAYGAQEHGDARRTIELLGKSAELAEKLGDSIINMDHVKRAHELIEYDGAFEVLKKLPEQSKAVMLAISLDSKTGDESTTATVYKIYKEVCRTIDMPILTQRRISDLILEFGQLGYVDTHLEFKGRYGRSRKIDMIVNPATTNRIITDDYRFNSLKDMIRQTKSP